MLHRVTYSMLHRDMCSMLQAEDSLASVTDRWRKAEAQALDGAQRLAGEVEKRERAEGKLAEEGSYPYALEEGSHPVHPRRRFPSPTP